MCAERSCKGHASCYCVGKYVARACYDLRVMVTNQCKRLFALLWSSRTISEGRGLVSLQGRQISGKQQIPSLCYGMTRLGVLHEPIEGITAACR